MKKTTRIFLPLIISTSICAGIFLGVYLNSREPMNGVSFILPSSNNATKLTKIVNYIDAYYVDSVQKERLVDVAISSILKELDPHTYYISQDELSAYTEPLEGAFEGIGIEFLILRDTIVVVNPINGGPSELLGIQAGDRIVQVNGEKVAGVGIKNKDVMRLLKGPKGTEVEVGIKRNSSKDLLLFDIQRNSIPINSIDVSMILQDTIAYVRLSRFSRTSYHELSKSLDSLIENNPVKEIILDLRGNGGGILGEAVKICDSFLPKGDLIVYTAGKSRPKQEYFSKEDGKYLNYNVKILINEASASASEIVAGALQDNDQGIIIGRRSFGKGLVQEHLSLPDRSALRLTVARYYTPVGRSIQKPYGKKIDYNADYETRVNDGELFHQDSIRNNDSLVYVTAGGKKVYGGGGITPDVFVPADTSRYASIISNLIYSGTLNQYAFDIVDHMRHELSKFETAKRFDEQFEISNNMIDSLFSEKYHLKFDEKKWLKSHDLSFLKKRLKAQIARNTYGSEGFYQVMIKDDDVVVKALKPF